MLSSMHSCLNTRLGKNQRLNCPAKYMGMHACMHKYQCTCNSVIELQVWAHPWAHGFLCGKMCLFMCAHGYVCLCMRLRMFSGFYSSVPYLALEVGGVQQVPNCCHPHNGFYKPGAGTGPWLSCWLGSPQLYPCRLHWRSSQSVTRNPRFQFEWTEITWR